jgi:hypothetical protein
MSLADWANVNEINEFATATDATGATELAIDTNIGLLVAPVASVAVAEPRKLKPKERECLLNWLQIIGETDHEEIEYTLKQCESDTVVREWFLSRARKLALFESK